VDEPSSRAQLLLASKASGRDASFAFKIGVGLRIFEFGLFRILHVAILAREGPFDTPEFDGQARRPMWQTGQTKLRVNCVLDPKRTLSFAFGTETCPFSAADDSFASGFSGASDSHESQSFRRMPRAELAKTPLFIGGNKGKKRLRRRVRSGLFLGSHSFEFGKVSPRLVHSKTALSKPNSRVQCVFRPAARARRGRPKRRGMTPNSPFGVFFGIPVI